MTKRESAVQPVERVTEEPAQSSTTPLKNKPRITRQRRQSKVSTCTCRHESYKIHGGWDGCTRQKALWQIHVIYFSNKKTPRIAGWTKKQRTTSTAVKHTTAPGTRFPCLELIVP